MLRPLPCSRWKELGAGPTLQVLAILAVLAVLAGDSTPTDLGKDESINDGQLSQFYQKGTGSKSS